MNTLNPRTLSAAVLSLALVLGACSEDKDAAGGSSASGSASGSASAASSGSTAEAACDPVGDGGGTEVAVTLSEWKVELDETEVAAGPVTFTIANEGGEPHELVVVEADSPDDLTVVDGKVDEDALPDGAFIGEVEAFPGGEDCEGTFELTPGRYVLFCNIVETEDTGEHESHYQEGMVTTFTVT